MGIQNIWGKIRNLNDSGTFDIIQVNLGNAWIVDGTTGIGNDQGSGDFNNPFATIGRAIQVANPRDTIYVQPIQMAAGATDPGNYAENVVIPATLAGLRIIGLGDDFTQGIIPQIKKGSGSSPQITVRAPGVLLAYLGINGGGATGGGILLDDDGSTKSAFGTVIKNCHIKNCVVSAHDSTSGGGIYWSSNGGGWQVRIAKNRFYDNVGGISLVGTGGSRPKDVIIDNNYFGGSVETTIDSYIYGAGGSGFNDIVIDRNVFATILPNITSGNVKRYMDLTGTVCGIVSNNFFAGVYTTTGFGAAKAAAKIPTSVGMPMNYSDAGLIVREA